MNTRPCAHSSKPTLESKTARGHTGHMANSDEIPAVMEPFPDKTGMGRHVAIRYREGRERLMEGFATKADAVDWIEANVAQVRE